MREPPEPFKNAILAVDRLSLPRRVDESFVSDSRIWNYGARSAGADDEWHSADEPREIIVGHSNANRLLLVCFTERAPGLIQVINARRATRRERKDYESRNE